MFNICSYVESTGDRPLESDGWDWREEKDVPKLRTTVAVDKTKSIIARNQSPDIAFDQSINAYRGCEHGCIYCFARPTHAYLGHSPGLDFESRLYMKPEAAKLLEAELRKPGYKPKVIAPPRMIFRIRPQSTIAAASAWNPR